MLDRRFMSELVRVADSVLLVRELLRAYPDSGLTEPSGTRRKGEPNARPARLRINRIVQPKTKKVAFELMCLAVSAINGCAACSKSHRRRRAPLLRRGKVGGELGREMRVALVVASEHGHEGQEAERKTRKSMHERQVGS
jgi:AhpD family alkylhydroperoxidase